MFPLSTLPLLHLSFCFQQDITNLNLMVVILIIRIVLHIDKLHISIIILHFFFCSLLFILFSIMFVRFICVDTYSYIHWLLLLRNMPVYDYIAIFKICSLLNGFQVVYIILLLELQLLCIVSCMSPCKHARVFSRTHMQEWITGVYSLNFFSFTRFCQIVFGGCNCLYSYHQF